MNTEAPVAERLGDVAVVQPDGLGVGKSHCVHVPAMARTFIELMTLARKLKAPREGPK